jgi:hypothetical protein
MTLGTIGILLLGAIVLLLYFFAEAVFELVFACIGAFVVWVFSFGRIRFDALDSELATAIGVIFLVVGAGLSYYIFHP